MFGNHWPLYGWLWRLIYGHGPIVSFLTVFMLTIVAMTALQLCTARRVSRWSEQYKGFIVGDVLLAIITGFIQRLAQRHPTTAHHSASYWIYWIVGGLVGSILFIAGEFAQGKIVSLAQLLASPQLLYHNVGLFALLIPALGGVGTPLILRYPSELESLACLVLLLTYIGLNVYDGLRPPVNAPHRSRTATTR